jgi:hypothetical protein
VAYGEAATAPTTIPTCRYNFIRVQSQHEVVLVRRDLRSVWRMRGDETLEGGKVWGVWFGAGGEREGESGCDDDDGPPCPLLLMIVGGRVVVLASSTMGFCHELLQYEHDV